VLNQRIYKTLDMKKYKITLVFVFISTLFWFASCSKDSSSPEETVEVKSKFHKLTDEIFKTGDFIKLENSPKLISAEDVYNSLDDNILILDIRRAKDYAGGHIKNSINLKLKELIDYAQVKGFPMYDKVIVVCYTGQTASYSSAALQLLGYNNIYVMKWGMCGWNKKFSERWESHTSNKGTAKLRNKDFPKNDSLSSPVIDCNKNSGPEILYARAKNLLNEGFGKATVKYNYLEAYAKKTYLVCCQTEDIYKKSHLKDAVFYGSPNSLNFSTDLLTLPFSKTIVVYSNDAHKSAYIAAYLKILGYDAKTLKYGADSFMNSKMLEFGYGFDKEDIKNYSFETSVYIEVEEEVQEGGC